MIKKWTLLGLVVTTVIIKPIISTVVSGNDQEYSHELNIKKILPIIEENRAVFLVTEYIGERIIEEDNNFDFLEEELEAEGEIIAITEPQEDTVAHNSNNKEEHQKVENKKQEEPRSTPITDNRTVAPDLSQHLNNYVLNVVNSYDYKGVKYPYLLNNDFENYNGVTEDIYYNGELLLKAHPSGKKYSHCTGITFEVFFKAMQNRNKANGIDINDFNGMTKDELFDFMLTWYVGMGPKSESNLALAIEKYGLGERITNLEEVVPGDFIDLSRENNTGHAVVFLDWIREGDKIIGLKHWSSQGSTSGISHKEEYFNIKDSNGQKYGNIILDSLYIGRVNPISEYR